MTAFVIALLENPVVRGFLEELAIKVIADIFHRRETDPAFKAKSDDLFRALSTAKTDEEAASAQNQLRLLMARQ